MGTINFLIDMADWNAIGTFLFIICGVGVIGCKMLSKNTDLEAVKVYNAVQVVYKELLRRKSLLADTTKIDEDIAAFERMFPYVTRCIKRD